MTRRIAKPGQLPELPRELRNDKNGELVRYMEDLLRALFDLRESVAQLIDESNKRA